MPGYIANCLVGCVAVPPDIIDSESSSDTTVREGSNVSLTCAARGHPQPHIVWRREDGAPIGRSKSKITSVEGEVLSLPRVSRVSIGAYLCIASNGVPPSVTHLLARVTALITSFSLV